MTRLGALGTWRRAMRSPQPVALRNRPSSARPGTERARSARVVSPSSASSAGTGSSSVWSRWVRSRRTDPVWCAVTTSAPEQGSDLVWVNRAVSIMQSQESGVTLTEREYKRYIERLEGCKPHGWSDLWLAVAGIGGGLCAAAVVALIALPSNTPAAGKEVLGMLAVLGAVMLVLCLIAYFSQRSHLSEEIDGLKKDFQMQIGSSA
jgi:hypothetical protein